MSGCVCTVSEGAAVPPRSELQTRVAAGRDQMKERRLSVEMFAHFSSSPEGEKGRGMAEVRQRAAVTLKRRRLAGIVREASDESVV